MATKAEVEAENADLRAQLAAAQEQAQGVADIVSEKDVEIMRLGSELASAPVPADGCCDNLCPCGVPYSRPCYSSVIGDMVRTCICPDHPGQAPADRVNA